MIMLVCIPMCCMYPTVLLEALLGVTAQELRFRGLLLLFVVQLLNARPADEVGVVGDEPLPAPAAPHLVGHLSIILQLLGMLLVGIQRRALSTAPCHMLKQLTLMKTYSLNESCKA